jgi:hypothetical protein
MATTAIEKSMQHFILVVFAMLGVWMYIHGMHRWVG